MKNRTPQNAIQFPLFLLTRPGHLGTGMCKKRDLPNLWPPLNLSGKGKYLKTHVSMCLYVYMYICILYVYVCVYIQIYIYIYMYMYIEIDQSTPVTAYSTRTSTGIRRRIHRGAWTASRPRRQGSTTPSHSSQSREPDAASEESARS